MAETSRVKDDSDKFLSRRRGLRLVAYLVEDKAHKAPVKKKTDRQFNITISDDIFSGSVRQKPESEAGSPPVGNAVVSRRTPVENPDRCVETPSITAPTRIAISLFAGGIIGYLIGSKRK